AIDERPSAFVIGRAGATAVGVAVVYFALQAGMTVLVGGSLPSHAGVAGPLSTTIAAFVVVSFAAVTLFQNQMMRRAEAPFWIAA
ncbi:hypothetical protein, partial [Staphylococcus aureus]